MPFIFLPGAASFRGVKSYEIFINEVVSRVKQELHERLRTGMYYVRLPDSLVSESADSIKLGEDRWARVFGLTFRFARNGYCNKWRKKGQNTLHCPVKFEDLEIQLPKLDNDTIVYVAHVTIKGMLIFQEGKCIPFMAFQQQNIFSFTFLKLIVLCIHLNGWKLEATGVWCFKFR